jgi:pantetheine-phosphate adenylyltransferase
MKYTLYPGTFDPLTLGHVDLIERSASIFEGVVVAVAVDTPKKTLFSVEERVRMGREVVAELSLGNVEVCSFRGLLIDYARHRGVSVMVRGLRAYSDFEYEFQLALTNRKMAPEVETLFMMPKEVHSYVTSSMVREIARLGGDPTNFVPAPVLRALRRRFRRSGQSSRRRYAH